MSDSFLLVPIKLQVLYLPAAQSVVSEMADFSRLPWSDGKTDYQTQTPYLGEAITTRPFQNKNLNLSSGFHLHWVLPRALRTSAADQGKVAFPAAPNRWLITRTTQGMSHQWIVESDYMSPTTSTFNMDAITVPVVQKDVNNGKTQPYMYLGRQLPLSEWLAEQSSKKIKNKYWKDIQGDTLTAMGYGEVSFNTFYPNCRSVFGFFDHEAPADANYELLGWYSNPNDDVLNNYTSINDIQETLKWKLQESNAQNSTSPNQSIFYGQIDSTSNQEIAQPKFNKIAVGNSGSEALSAFLAHTLNTEQKSNIEDQLEAILFGSKLPASGVDAGPNFEEARHKKGFDVEDGGPLWTLKKHVLNNHNHSKSTDKNAPELPENLASLLDTLNVEQHRHSALQNDLETQSFHLYSDWYKYMMCCYPPPGDKDDYPDVDTLRRYIELSSLPRVAKIKQTLGILKINTDDKVIHVTADDATSQSARTAKAFNVLEAALATFNKSLNSSGYIYEISHTSSARYYSPSDPVVLFATDSTDELINDEQNKTLNCLVSNAIQKSSSGLPFNPTDINSLINTAQADSLFKSRPGTWHPQTLEWLVSFFPVAPDSNIGSPDGLYHADFINKNFNLLEDKFDFTQQGKTVKIACEYLGKTYVSGGASTRFNAALESFITRRYPKSKSNFPESLSSIWTVYPQEKQDFSNPGYTAVLAYQRLAKHFILTQSLGGFHLALLQHTNTLSMPLADPLGFSSYQSFTAAVASALQDAYTAAPTPDALYMPIRCGNLSFLQLGLANQFGQVTQATLDHLITSNPLTLPNNERQCWLSPRLAQAARLSFRWLAASPLNNGDVLEMNSHPATNPVCGWLVPDYLDSSIVCFSQQGENLGSFDRVGQWQQTPAATHPVTTEDLTKPNPAKLNTHLLKMLINIKDTATTNKNYIVDLISAFQSTQQNIYPQSYAGHSALSLLMGKPIAIVRSQIKLDMKGGLRHDQGWVALADSMQQGSKSTSDYQKVKLPLRLGEYKQMDDGLIAYWIEDQEGNYEGNTLYLNDSKSAGYDPSTIESKITDNIKGIDSADISGFLKEKNGQIKRQDCVHKFNQGGLIFDELIRTSILTPLTRPDLNLDYYADAGLLNQTLSSDPISLTMLMDPHGIVHATTGILPVKTIQLPSEYYTKALNALSMNFLVSPLISPADKVQLTLPKEPGHNWAWLQKNETQWQRTADVICIEKAAFNKAWSVYASRIKKTILPGESPWQELLTKNWLVPLSGSETLFKVIPPNENSHQHLAIWKDYGQDISELIQALSCGLLPFSSNADFYPEQRILEGWLELSSDSPTH